MLIDAAIAGSVHVFGRNAGSLGFTVGQDGRKLSAAAGKLGIDILAVDTPFDWVSHPNIGNPADLQDAWNPTYPKAHGLPMPNHLNHDRVEVPPSDAQNQWHTHTSSFMAVETRGFLAVVWR